MLPSIVALVQFVDELDFPVRFTGFARVFMRLTLRGGSRLSLPASFGIRLPMTLWGK
jgi:hypothetical protein